MAKKQHLFLLIIWCLLITLSGNEIMAHPKKKISTPRTIEALQDNEEYILTRTTHLRNNFLVLRVEFPNYRFNTESNFPSYHPSDQTYFDKYMQHARNYYLDASKGQYNLIYRISEHILMADHNLEWYGQDNVESSRRVLLINEVVQKADLWHQEFFEIYEGVIVFHAGPGQETDIYNKNSQMLWSSYISLATLRYYLDDPENTDYQGIPVSNGTYFIDRLAFMPENQFHRDFPEDINHHFELVGVLTNQIGRILGFPSMSGGEGTAGLGVFCVMASGIWNNNGAIPPLPNAWIRYFAGWETPLEIVTDTINIPILYPQDIALENIEKPQLYKVPITEKEYFLIENRQMNFRSDKVELRGVPVFGFDLLYPFEYVLYSAPSSDTEQTYMYLEPTASYPDEVWIAMPDLMKNSLSGCEWDYFLPFTDYSSNRYVDGGGLLIYHIDENIIEQRIEVNSINGNPLHRGVAIEEADGIEHLSSNFPSYYRYGGPFDTFRKGVNDYFGYRTRNINGQEVYSFPEASSYYGGVNFEIHSISESKKEMSFAVNFAPYCQIDYHLPQVNYLEPFVYDFNKNGVNEVHYFQPDGTISVFENHQLLGSYWAFTDTLAFNYTFNGQDQFFLPLQNKESEVKAILMSWDGEQLHEVWSVTNEYWISSPLFVDNIFYSPFTTEAIKWILQTQVTNSLYKIYLLDENYHLAMDPYEIEAEKISNITYDGSCLKFITYQREEIQEHRIGYPQSELDLVSLVEQEFEHTSRLLRSGKLSIQNMQYLETYSYRILNINNTEKSFLLFLKNTSADTALDIREVELPFLLRGSISLKDTNNNGQIDIIIPHANGFQVYNMYGKLMNNVVIKKPDYNDIYSGSGLLVWNLPEEENIAYVGGFSHNRLIFFDHHLQEIESMTRTLAYPLKTLPFISIENNQVKLDQATDFGRIYRIDFKVKGEAEKLQWEYYYRQNFWREISENMYTNQGIFVKNEVYIFPNPFISRYHDKIKFQIMTTQDTEVVVKIYTIAGQLLAQKREKLFAYVSDVEQFSFTPRHWSSGVYLAIIEAHNTQRRIKFSIEK